MSDTIKAAIKAARERDAQFLNNGVIVGTVAGRMEIRFAEALAVAVKMLSQVQTCSGDLCLSAHCCCEGMQCKAAISRIAAILEGKP